MTKKLASAGSVAVLGLGPMGSALARALLRAGVSTVVWNRSPGRAQLLAADGAVPVTEPDEAVAAADLLVLCLRDHDAARAVLGGVAAPAWAGKVVVNLSSSTPEDGRRSAAWATRRGIDYLNGAIMVPTPLIGDPDALILYAGDRALFERVADRLRPLAGRSDHVGADPGAAALHDVAMLEVFFAGMTSFLHAAAMVTAQGVPATTFLPYAQQIVEVLGQSLPGLAAGADTGEHAGDEDTLAMELAALQHIVDTSAETDLDPRLPELMRDLARRAVDGGHGGDSFSRVVDQLRAGPTGAGPQARTSARAG